MVVVTDGFEKVEVLNFDVWGYGYESEGGDKWEGEFLFL